jgi:hypothetical protein
MLNKLITPLNLCQVATGIYLEDFDLLFNQIYSHTHSKYGTISINQGKREHMVFGEKWLIKIYKTF